MILIFNPSMRNRVLAKLPPRSFRASVASREMYLNFSIRLSASLETNGTHPLSTRTNFIIIFLIILCSIIPSHAFLNYDRAISRGQKKDWQTSVQLLQQELVKNPHNPTLLYDTGVSSYKNGDYEHALSYFLKAADAPQSSPLLQEQALFNAGNTQVALKELQESLATFDKVLALNPKNAQAAHNKEMVKKMLEEQKQQEQQQQDQNKKDTDKQKDQQKNSNNNDQSQSEEKKEKTDTDQQQPSNPEQEKKHHDKPQSQEKNKPQNGQEKEDQKEASQSDQQSKAQQQKASAQKDTQQKSGSQELSSEKEKSEQFLHPATAQLLDEQEKKDAKLNKQMMKMMVGSQNAGADHNEHYW